MHTASSSSVDRSRWKCVYPNYIDKLKKRKDGRRISQDDAIESPGIAEIVGACEALGLVTIVEDKCYPRDWMIRGRVRVQLKNNESGELCNENITGKEILLKFIAVHIANVRDSNPSMKPKPVVVPVEVPSSSIAATSSNTQSKKKKKK